MSEVDVSEALEISAHRKTAIANYPWPMGSETPEELAYMVRFRKRHGLSDDPPHNQGVAGGKD